MNALRWVFLAVAVAACAPSARAADQPGAPAALPMFTDPAAGGGCATCGGRGGPALGCSTCGKLLRGHERFGFKHKNTLYQVNLCPGACFGYFQTQWRKWDDACPYPYLGVGASDGAKRPAPAAPARPEQMAPPRPVEPKKNGTDPKAGAEPKKNGLPAIPVPNKFGP